MIPTNTPRRKPPRTLIIRVLAGLVVLFLAAQFVRPSFDNPPVTGEIRAPANIKPILVKACYDCHSNQPRLAWFDQLTPANWLVAADIRDARKVLNFSEWENLPADQQKGRLFECLNQVVFNTMPLKQYLLLHGDAKVTPAERVLLKNWLASLAPLRPSASSKTAAADSQYRQWKAAAPNAKNIKTAPNGIAFMNGYENWKAISTSDRFDNGTMRAILGNEIAVKAIKENRINPWPDGAAFAKVAWDAVTDSPVTMTRAGEFKQVEFMIKDAARYKTTDGWGWGRWKGMELKPYGKNALFVTECMNCHKPMQDKDFVFTMPIADHPPGPADTYNQTASLPGTLPFDPLGWAFVGSSIDRKEATMSTLYAKGPERVLVTWSQQEDRHWFGANIPGTPSSIERILPGPAGSQPFYERYEGRLLKKMDPSGFATIKDRIAFILNYRASVMPAFPL